MAYITLEGADADNTIIEWDDTADRMGQSGHPLGTFASATFAVDAPYFIAKNITFKVSKFRDLGFHYLLLVYSRQTRLMAKVIC
jgi:pectin methylesterase-like acyl-CoA thioesterase